jgi:hypothetical protein
VDDAVSSPKLNECLAKWAGLSAAKSAVLFFLPAAHSCAHILRATSSMSATGIITVVLR